MASFERVETLYRSCDLVILDHRCRPSNRPGPVEPETVWLPTVGFVLHGLGVMDVDGATLHADANHCLLLNPLESYRVRHFGCRGEACALTLQISEALAEELFGTPRFCAHLVSRHPATGLELQALRRALAAGPGGPGSAQVERGARSLLADVADRLSRSESAGGAAGGRGSRPVDRVKRRLAECFREKLPLDDLARKAGCSKYHLCRRFRREEGMTIGTYVHRLRVEEALTRLARAEEEEDLTALARDLGFSSHSHFTAVFRKLTGSTPSQVRRRLVDECPRPGASLGGA